MEVPLDMVVPPPLFAVVTDSPGASNCRKDAEFEKLETTSLSEVEPTPITFERQAGVVIAFVKDSFPEAATVSTPAARRSAIAFNCEATA